MNDNLNNAKFKLNKAIENLEERLNKIRAGRANPSTLDDVYVSYYGVPTQLKQLATISVPEARQISIKPFDKTILGSIEKAIYEANLGIAPNNNGEVVFLSIPPLTEDRRKELVKQAKEVVEEGRITIRNIRRDIIEDIKKEELSEDVEKGILSDLQNIIDDYNKKVEEMLKLKEKDLMEI